MCLCSDAEMFLEVVVITATMMKAFPPQPAVYRGAEQKRAVTTERMFLMDLTETLLSKW